MCPTPPSFDYDFIVIGGGSGGLASAKEAAACGARVVVFDFVKPSTQGTHWGLGGTCVNVGCVPKKLMHYAAGMQQILSWDSKKMGWSDFEKIDEETGEPVQVHEHCNWTRLVQCVQAYVKQLNFSYRTGLRAAGCTYMNALATIKDPHSVEYEEKGIKKRVTAKHILVAVGGRPSIPDSVQGAQEFAKTSDDLFSLQTPPGKTLIVGASYIALECAGLLTELGFEVVVAVRSLLLRGFDRQCALKVGRCMREMGVTFMEGVLVEKIEKTQEEKLRVTLRGSLDADRLEHMEFDTVLYATGRSADTKGLNLEELGVKCSAEGRIICTEGSATTSPSIYAVGDVVEGFPELTPAAIQAGEILARRLFKNSTELMSTNNVPTTVFTPVEYGCVGLSEEAAIEEHGDSNIEVFLTEFCPLELSACHRQKAPSSRLDEADIDLTPPCLAKLICLKSENMKVIGVHFVGPNAGEVIQGMAIAVRLGATKADFDKTVGIHPTNAECFTQLSITRRSGKNWMAAGGCGGGKCG
ncbi:thioredoxin reductase [Cyclospora cayetanensis]|uniref:Thioredoxin reductase n=1 Tax=Cyclospora cayetanensis TaxID=88456 RepID=A0A6P6RWN2_9EIME|nr:thioredoxin reductase [Cyclospora cayetanensis]